MCFCFLRTCSITKHNFITSYFDWNNGKYIGNLSHIYVLTAPTRFDIVECSDHSITVKWYINGLDDCLVYTLAYRPEGSDNWNRLELSTADVLIKENRCHVYTIKPLSPGTNYELKIRCLNYLVKSRYTNCNIKRTLQNGKILISLQYYPDLQTYKDVVRLRIRPKKNWKQHV